VDVTDTAVANPMAPDAADVDIHGLLEELETKLSESVEVMAPMMDEIRSNLKVAAASVRHQGDATELWASLNDLQSFLSLLQQICQTSGAGGDSIMHFDRVLGEALAELEICFRDDADAEAIAGCVENRLIGALDAWKPAEACIRDIVAGS